MIEEPIEGRERRLAMLGPLRRRNDASRRRFRRGVYLLPSLFTLGNLYCGYACIIHAMRGEFELAAPFIGFAFALDALDGRIARLTGTESAFGLEFDSLADVVSFGIAPAILVFNWGLEPLQRLGWTAGFIFVTAAAARLARFNIQTASTDKRYFVGMPSPAAAAVPAATVFAYPEGINDPWQAAVALLVVLVPGFLMVSTIRFRSFKTFDLRVRRSYKVIAVIAVIVAIINVQPRIMLVLIAYGYLLSGLIGFVIARLRRRKDTPQAAPSVEGQR